MNNNKTQTMKTYATELKTYLHSSKYFSYCIFEHMLKISGQSDNYIQSYHVTQVEQKCKIEKNQPKEN